jgi:hypothetical protein
MELSMHFFSKAMPPHRVVVVQPDLQLPVRDVTSLKPSDRVLVVAEYALLDPLWQWVRVLPASLVERHTALPLPQTRIALASFREASSDLDRLAQKTPLSRGLPFSQVVVVFPHPSRTFFRLLQVLPSACPIRCVVWQEEAPLLSRWLGPHWIWQKETPVDPGPPGSIKAPEAHEQADKSTLHKPVRARMRTGRLLRDRPAVEP